MRAYNGVAHGETSAKMPPFGWLGRDRTDPKREVLSNQTVAPVSFSGTKFGALQSSKLSAHAEGPRPDLMDEEVMTATNKEIMRQASKCVKRPLGPREAKSHVEHCKLCQQELAEPTESPQSRGS